MAGAEDMLREIARIESHIQELLDYRSGLEAHTRAASGWWARCKSYIKLILLRKQIEVHLRCLRLELEKAHEKAHNSYETLEKDEPSSAS